MKSLFGVIGTIVPLLYCGGLVYYFIDLSGSPQQAASDGLGPTLLGLGAVGLLFSIPLMLKIIAMLPGRRPSASGGGGGPADGGMDDGKTASDAEAVIARYIARQSAAQIPSVLEAPPARHGGGSTKPTSFGRKTS